MKILSFIALFGIASSSVFAQDVGNIIAIKNSQYIIRSTLGMGGQSIVIAKGKSNYYVSQSIGQASVIGTSVKNKYTIRQGFQQPHISVQIFDHPEMNDLNANLYPNPFQQSINVLFKDLVKEEITVKIYNFSGGILQSKMYPATQLLDLPLNSLTSGKYVLKISSNNKQIISTIIKQ